MTTSQNIRNAVMAGDRTAVRNLVADAMERGDKAGDIMKNMIAAMDLVGEKMGAKEMFIPEVLMAAAAMREGTELLKPHLAESEANNQGVIVIGSVRGDLHDIGKNLVEIMLEGAGYTVIDVGIDVSTDKFVSAVRENKADMLGLSALLTTTMPAMQEVIEALATAGLRDRVRIMIGGAPVTETYAEKIGADAYGEDAGSAVRIARSFL